VLEFVGEMHGLARAEARERALTLIGDFDLGHAGEEFAVNYSLGMKKKLGLACALVHRPRVLLLDEPTTGLDPRASREVRELLQRCAADGTTVFLSTHLLDMAERLCHRVGILMDGKLRSVGKPDELRREFAAGGSLEDVYLAVTREQEESPAPAPTDGRVASRARPVSPTRLLLRLAWTRWRNRLGFPRRDAPKRAEWKIAHPPGRTRKPWRTSGPSSFRPDDQGRKWLVFGPLFFLAASVAVTLQLGALRSSFHEPDALRHVVTLLVALWFAASCSRSSATRASRPPAGTSNGSPRCRCRSGRSRGRACSRGRSSRRSAGSGSVPTGSRSRSSRVARGCSRRSRGCSRSSPSSSSARSSWSSPRSRSTCSCGRAPCAT
jgi:hypothetical protein